MLILDELWYRDTIFESYISKDREYKKEAIKLHELNESFMTLLSKEQKKAFTDLNDQQLKVQSLAEKDAFISGLRFGVEFILDVFCNIELNFS